MFLIKVWAWVMLAGGPIMVILWVGWSDSGANLISVFDCY